MKQAVMTERRGSAKDDSKKRGSWRRVFKSSKKKSSSKVLSPSPLQPFETQSWSTRKEDYEMLRRTPQQQPLAQSVERPNNIEVAVNTGPIDGDTLLPLSRMHQQEMSERKMTPTSFRSLPQSQNRGPNKKPDTRTVLARDFGRTSLPPKLARNWVVEVSPAEWDAEENQWKYRILVQRRNVPQNQVGGETISSFTNAFTWRSIADFCWLENALKAEYHGSLMLPLLSIAIGTADVEHTEYEVDATLLRDWLGDVFNGIRGQGELLLDMSSVDLISSEAMEAFLYRNTDPLPNVDPHRMVNKSLLPATSTLDINWSDSPEKVSWDNSEEDSFVKSLFTKPFSCTPIDALCALDTTTTPKGKKQSTKGRQPLTNNIPLDMINCSSRAVGQSPTLQAHDSFVENPSHQQQNSSNMAIHSELLEAEKELVASYRSTAMSAMEKLSDLTEEETQIGAAWKRFAIALSNLFAFEKEIESTRIGVKEKKENMPFRKLRKKDVEDCLRVMARQRMDHSIPSLQTLSTMLGTYVGDLSAVEPATEAYSQAVRHLTNLEFAAKKKNSPKNRKETDGEECVAEWHEQLKALAAIPFGEVRKQFTGSSGASLHTDSTAASSTDGETINAQQKRAFEQRVLENELRLRQFITSLCQGVPIRVARMAWKFFKMESGHAALLKGASVSLHTKVNIASQDDLEEMSKRHEKENIKDDKTEVELVQRIVDIGNKRKFKRSESHPNGMSESESDESATATLDEDESNEDEKSILRHKAVETAQERPGLWDSKLALSIMEAVGIHDAEVRVEETTRDLRVVRKHAIDLRENLARCVEAVEVLTSVIIDGEAGDDWKSPRHGQKRDKSVNHIRETRQQFITDMSDLFSGKFIPQRTSNADLARKDSPSSRVLAGAGIELLDRAGWATVHDDEVETSMTSPPKLGSGHQCGRAALSYVNKMDAGIEKLLEGISALLDSYRERVEGIESFVYMHCVGIQLEKHFNNKRSEALAAWEKKTDITTAINIATRKGLPLLVKELQAKLDGLTPRNVSHTTVKETKEMHLLSKTLKGELQDLANRRFMRAREMAPARVVELMTLWAKYEEATTNIELLALTEAIEEIEKSVNQNDFPPLFMET